MPVVVVIVVCNLERGLIGATVTASSESVPFAPELCDTAIASSICQTLDFRS
jgi:hypothetical protein